MFGQPFPFALMTSPSRPTLRWNIFASGSCVLPLIFRLWQPAYNTFHGLHCSVYFGGFHSWPDFSFALGWLLFLASLPGSHCKPKAEYTRNFGMCLGQVLCALCNKMLILRIDECWYIYAVGLQPNGRLQSAFSNLCKWNGCKARLDAKTQSANIFETPLTCFRRLV